MIRKAIPAIAALLWGCAEPPPQPHADGEIVVKAVEHAQAQVYQPGLAPSAASRERRAGR